MQKGRIIEEERAEIMKRKSVWKKILAAGLAIFMLAVLCGCNSEAEQAIETAKEYVENDKNDEMLETGKSEVNHLFLLDGVGTIGNINYTSEEADRRENNQYGEYWYVTLEGSFDTYSNRDGDYLRTVDFSVKIWLDAETGQVLHEEYSDYGDAYVK